ncbi:hypothetical protein O3P69_001673 [Scylla paramamosain]|uniref:Secreted protein n=1 Tax=Scylla paramamosain TaxID=85552 RepID=A0AAW0V3Q9_SCYPA
MGGVISAFIFHNFGAAITGFWTECLASLSHQHHHLAPGNGCHEKEPPFARVYHPAYECCLSYPVSSYE